MPEVIVIGAGPAGLTAGIYLGRAMISGFILEKMAVGGQAILTQRIENFPGFPAGISSQQFTDNLIRQVKDLGIKIKKEEVLEIATGDGGFRVKTGERQYNCRAVIIATGAEPKTIGIPGERELTGRGVSYCATCDAPLFRDKIVSVIGGGDKALEEALYLSRFAKKIFLIHRREEFRATKILQEEVFREKKIEVVLDYIPLEIIGEHKVEAIKIKNVKTQTEKVLACSGSFIFIGITPNTKFLHNLVDKNQEGFIITDEEMHTSQDGIFACGDCRKRPLYQIITACSEGAIAAMSCYKYLETLK